VKAYRIKEYNGIVKRIMSKVSVRNRRYLSSEGCCKIAKVEKNSDTFFSLKRKNMTECKISVVESLENETSSLGSSYYYTTFMTG